MAAAQPSLRRSGEIVFNIRPIRAQPTPLDGLTVQQRPLYPRVDTCPPHLRLAGVAASLRRRVGRGCQCAGGMKDQSRAHIRRRVDKSHVSSQFYQKLLNDMVSKHRADSAQQLRPPINIKPTSAL